MQLSVILATTRPPTGSRTRFLAHAASRLARQARSRALAVLAAFLAILAVVGGGTVGGVTTAAAQAGGGQLLVADPAAQKLYVYRLPDLDLIGQFDDIALGAHAGTVALPDGRVLFVDDKHAEFVVLQLSATGGPSIVGKAPIPTPQPFGRAGWAMLDPTMTYFAVSSDDDGAASQTVTLLDLQTMQVGQLQLELKKNRTGVYEEVHPYLAGSPLTLYVTAGEEIRAFNVADVMAGAAQPVGSTPISPYPHGPVLSHALNRLYVTTSEGINVLDVDGNQLHQPRVIRWEAGGVRVTQNFRPRLSYDGGYIYGAVTAVTTPALTAQEWAKGEAFVHVADLQTETRGLIRLGRGVIGRFQLSEPLAIFSNVHPDGDAALLLDIQPSSPTFQQVVARIPLERLTNGPVADQPVAGKEGRSVAITPDGAWAFVSHGGDGRISVIETAAKRVAQTIELPSPLKGGGYMAAVQIGSRLVDPSAR
jgi:hypothetical protein